MQQRILAARAVLVVDQQPVEPGEPGDFNGHRGTKVEEGAAQPLARENPSAKIWGQFHMSGGRGWRLQ
jgi:hypothetical protein